MFVGIAISIGLHEIGHLVPAKLFGVKVTQYMIGFGKTLFSVRKKETEYGVKMIPLGGYIAMTGMYPPKKDQEIDLELASDQGPSEEDDRRGFYRLNPWKRIIVMLGGPTMNLIIGIVLFAILFMGFGVSQSSMTIASVSQCMIPANVSKTSCETGDPLAPGAAAGLLPGDTILSIDGKEIKTWDEITETIRHSAGHELRMEIERDGVQSIVPVTPEKNEVAKRDPNGQVIRDAQGNIETQAVGFVGIGPKQELVRQSGGTVLPAVGSQIQAVTRLITELPGHMVDVWKAVTGVEKRDADGPISVVGVGRAAGELTALEGVTFGSKMYVLFGMLASLNIALFVFNMIPLLPLDGGHIAGALWESIRRAFARLFKKRDPGPVDISKLLPLTYVVVGLLGAMTLLLIYADIVTPVSLFG